MTMNARHVTEDAHVIIDPFHSTQWSRAGIDLLRRSHLHENIRVIEDYSYRAIPQLDREGERFDMVFLDGHHCLDYTLTDVLTSDRVLEIEAMGDPAELSDKGWFKRYF